MSASLAVLRLTGMKVYCASAAALSAPHVLADLLGKLLVGLPRPVFRELEGHPPAGSGTSRISSAVAVFRLMCTNAFS